MPDLTDPSLFKAQCLLTDGWRDAADGTTIFVTIPAEGREIGCFPQMAPEEIPPCIQASRIARIQWTARPDKERSAILRRCYGLMIRHADDLAANMTTEPCKPLAQARRLARWHQGISENQVSAQRFAKER